MSSSKRKHSSGKSLFVGCFNWHGEIHTIHTHAFSTPSEEADAIKSVRKGGILRRLRDTILQPKSPSMDREGG